MLHPFHGHRVMCSSAAGARQRASLLSSAASEPLPFVLFDLSDGGRVFLLHRISPIHLVYLRLYTDPIHHVPRPHVLSSIFVRVLMEMIFSQENP